MAIPVFAAGMPLTKAGPGLPIAAVMVVAWRWKATMLAYDPDHRCIDWRDPLGTDLYSGAERVATDMRLCQLQPKAAGLD